MLRKIYEKAEKLLANRLLALIILIVVLYCVLIGRVFVLQIVEGQSHKNAYNKLVYTVNFQNDNAFQTLAAKNGTSESYEKNKVIYKVIKILERNGDSFINEIPIEYTGSGKFRFTETGSK